MASQISGGDIPIGVTTIVQNSATAILKGMVVLRDSDTDPSTGVRCAASEAPKVAGIALEDGPGNGKPFRVCYAGEVEILNTSGGALSADDLLVSHSDGGLKAAVATDIYLIGDLLMDVADDERGLARLNIRQTILA